METQELPIREVNLSEADVQRVSSELDIRPEGKAEAPQVSQEQIRQALVAVLPKPQPSVTAGPTAQPGTEAAQQRVASLLQMAVTDGIDAAHAAASADEPFILDALHDALAGALYDQLKAEGKL